MQSSFANIFLCIFFQTCSDIVQSLENLYPEDPQECVEAVVSHVLIPETVDKLVQCMKPCKFIFLFIISL